MTCGREKREREREEVPGKTEAPDSQAEPQENLISHQSEVRFPLIFLLPLRLFNESDMCSQFVCIKQTNTRTHTLAHTLALLFFLCFTIFMLFVSVSHTKQPPQRWGMHLINEETAGLALFQPASGMGVLLIRLSK